MHRRCYLRCEVNGRREHAAHAAVRGGGHPRPAKQPFFGCARGCFTLSQSLGSSLGTLIVTIVHCSNTNVKLGSDARAARSCLLLAACCLLLAACSARLALGHSDCCYWHLAAHFRYSIVMAGDGCAKHRACIQTRLLTSPGTDPDIVMFAPQPISFPASLT